MNRLKDYLILQLVILVYVSSSIVSKLASNETFLSFKFILFYGILLFILFVYAILWQQMLKRFPLTIAYASKATTIVWSMLVGYFFFNEGITITNLIGAIIVIIGIVVMVKGEESHE